MSEVPVRAIRAAFWALSDVRGVGNIQTGRIGMPSIDRPRVRAPGFPESLDWVNSGGGTLRLEELRGKIILLDFWTYG